MEKIKLEFYYDLDIKINSIKCKKLLEILSKMQYYIYTKVFSNKYQQWSVEEDEVFLRFAYYIFVFFC